MSQVPRDSAPAPESLPPVEPPNTRFLVQLFFIPAVIVAMLIGLWLVFQWVSQPHADSATYLNEIRRSTPSRWKTATNLAADLQSSAELRGDREFARELGKLLEQEVATPTKGTESSQYLLYLATALGMFDVDEPVDVLAKATQAAGNDNRELRLASVASLAKLMDRLCAKGEHPELAERVSGLLLEQSHSDDELMRSWSAFALGGVPSAAATDRLHEMLSDRYLDASYNAAIALARKGDPAATDVLCEMLAVDNTASLTLEKDEQFRELKRLRIITNGLNGIEALVAAAPQLDRQRFLTAVEGVEQSSLSAELKALAKVTHQKLVSQPQP